MQVQNWSDKDLIDMVKNGPPEGDKALRHVFEQKDWKGAVVGFILKNGGSFDVANEMAVLALEIFDRNIRNDQFNGGSDLKTYFTAIAKRQWFKHLKRKKTFVEIDPQRDDQYETNVEDYILSIDLKKYLEMATGVLGEGCKEVFRIKGLDYSNEVMAERLGLANAEMAKKKLYRCRKRFMEYLADHPHWKTLLNR